jgi:trimethylamine--corrinoid protein Co-methyltransferase
MSRGEDITQNSRPLKMLRKLAAELRRADAPGWESAKASASNLLMCALCGADTANGMGLLDGCTLLYPEELVLDTDIYHQVRPNAAGLDTSREALALNVIKDVGLRGHFIRHRHTRKTMRQRQFSDITRQLGPNGVRDPIEVAREKTEWILEHHHPEPLEELQQAEFRRILQAAEQELE